MPTTTFFNLTEEKQQRIYQAALNEFSKHSFKEAKLSNIITEAKIPRGSLYQYFTDKKDILRYIIDIGGKKKMEYMSQLLKNPNDLSFIELFQELYITGIKFAMNEPKLSKMMGKLLLSSGDIFHEFIAEYKSLATSMYVGYIKRDIEVGRIHPNVDPETLASLVYMMTANIITYKGFDEFGVLHDDELLDEVNKIVYIFQKGIENGEM